MLSLKRITVELCVIGYTFATNKTLIVLQHLKIVIIELIIYKMSVTNLLT